MIKEFFENSEIFVTGGSGVVGKALIEKLLRSCNVKKIYVLLRPKKNVSIEDRLEKVKNAMVFRQLKLQKPDELDKKLMAIPGDAVVPFLGITPEYQQILKNVSIVFHCAATVRFDEPLRDALRLNVGGTLETLKFAETLKNLKVFMHVSTFFSNPYLERVEEKVYESPMDWRVCLNLLERNDISEEQLDIITRKLIIGFPNTYCFTKNLAESLVNDYKDKLPVAIYRPSIVLFAIEEPEPGFAPSLMGAMGLFAVTAAGILKTIYIGKDTRLDLTPQDFGIKNLCYYTVKTANLYKSKNKPQNIPVFLTSSCTHSELTFRQYIHLVQDHGFWAEAAFEKNLLIPGLHCTDNRLMYLFLVLFKHILPSLLADFGLILSGRKPVLMSVHRKLYITLEVMKPFLFNSYSSSGITDADEMMAKLKGTEFNMDILPACKEFYRNVGFCQTMVYSVREHLFKEDPKTLPKSRKILQTKIFVYKVIKFLLTIMVFGKLLHLLGYFWSEKLPRRVKANKMLPEFYKDKEIFITGGSGIVGTALIEQLLRSCDVRKIYLLLRPKRSMTLEKRLERVKEEQVFRQLKIQKPQELDQKLVAIAGDAKLPMLGITEESAKLMKNVSIIYHCAATVRFDEPIRDALKLNVGGTLEAIKFAQTLKKLKIFMHVSTFYSNPYLTRIEPKFYKAPMDWKFCLDLLERKDIGEEELDIITRKLIVGFPNTYCFTKNLAESLVNDYRDKLPVCIYRPSIVFFALEQPEPGFSPSLMGVMGLFAVTGAGLLKTIYINKKNRLDITPQDVSVKNMLYYTFKAAQVYEKSKPLDIPVYMTSTCTNFDMTLIEYIQIMDDFGLWEKAAYEKSLLVPGIRTTSNRFIYMFFVLLLQLLPALLVDFVLLLTGRKPVLMRIQRKVFQTLEVMQPFMFNNYESEGITHYQEMKEKLKDTTFSVDVLDNGCDLFTNVGFCNNMVFSARDLLFKEDPKSLPKARRIFKLKVWLYKFVQFIVLYKVYVWTMEYIKNSYAEWRHNDFCSLD
ncbi:uncharacterized protein LOC111674798 [Lucilia cuprina]|uniref:uncharacterized protein LOC111674798 n=1 Tax=Lucilia cuprina TaxID=7375 RepID=UPI001F06E255|nr:uncharacterized protein LOC111674798 [Lucilia cuprina]